MEQFGYIDTLEIIKNPSILKRSLLMFDSIIVPDLFHTSEEIGETLDELKRKPELILSEFFQSIQPKYRFDFETFFYNSMRVQKELFWLKNEGMVGEMMIYDASAMRDSPPITNGSVPFKKPFIKVSWKSKEDLIDFGALDAQEMILQLYDTNRKTTSIEIFNSGSRKLLQHCRFNGVNVYPVFNNSLPLIDQKIAHKDEVLFVLLKNIPTPSEDTSYEQIKDFFQDPDSKEKMVRLKDWVNEFTSMKYSFIELQEKIDFLISEYRSHMALHKIKHQAGAFETVIKGTAEMMEAAVGGKFSKIVNPLFAARHQQIAMLESEREAPGRRLAYIIKTQDEFGE